MSEFYRDKAATQWRVGMFTIVALAVLIVGYLWFQEMLEAADYREVQVRFPAGGGLKPGDPVQIQGVKRGKVLDIRPEKTGAMVTLSVAMDFPLPVDSEILILDENLMGGKMVNILPGTSDELLDLDRELKGELRPGPGDLMAMAEPLLEETRSFIAMLNEQKSTLENFNRASDEVLALTRSLNRLVHENEPVLTRTLDGLEKTITDVKETSGIAGRFLEDSGDSLSLVLTDTRTTLRDARQSMQYLRNVTTRMDSILAGIEKGKGTAGMLVQDPDLYHKLSRAVDTLDELVKDIRENPTKYFHFSVF